MQCPVETVIKKFLVANNIEFIGDDYNEAKLDFYLPAYDIYIEVCQFHTPRKIEQLSRHKNVILIQGIEAAKALVNILSNKITP